MIGAFLHAARLGLFELSWNVLCPGCGGVLDTTQTLKSMRRDSYDCALCACGYEPTLDEMVEVTFTVSPRVRHIAAHDPHLLPIVEYFRQIFWGSGVDLPETGLDELIEEITLDAIELAPGEKGLDVAAAAGGVHHRVRAGDARRALHRRQGRADPRAAEPGDDLQQDPCADRHHRAAPRPAAAVVRQSQRRAHAAVGVGRRRKAAPSARQAPGIPDRQAAPHQPDLPRHLSHRHVGRRPGPEDHQPDVPVHRPQRLDRALRPGRRRGRLRLGAPALPRAAGDRGVGGGRRGQDDRRCGDGHVPDARPRARRGAAHARTRCAPSRKTS